MVALASATDRLGHGDAALRAAVSNLLEAIEAFRGVGRADVVIPLRAAAALAREGEMVRRLGRGGLPKRDPADWFLDD